MIPTDLVINATSGSQYLVSDVTRNGHRLEVETMKILEFFSTLQRKLPEFTGDKLSQKEQMAFVKPFAEEVGIEVSDWASNLLSFSVARGEEEVPGPMERHVAVFASLLLVKGEGGPEFMLRLKTKRLYADHECSFCGLPIIWGGECPGCGAA